MTTMENYLFKGVSELGVVLTRQQFDSFATLAGELCKWNRKINLTTIITPEEIAIKHFTDSLALGKYLDLDGKLLDIGSGAGFPAIPLKIAFPWLDVVTVDAVEKKILFQRHIARQLGFDKFTAVHCRAESLPNNYHGCFNRIVSRAFSELSEFVKYALPLLDDTGIIVAMKGKDGKKEADDSAEALKKLGAYIEAIHEFELPLFKDARSLIIIRRK